MDDIQLSLRALRRRISVGALFIACLLPLAGTAEEARLYAVELIVFSRDGGGFEEIWPDQLALRYPDRAQRLALSGSGATQTGGAAAQPPLWTSLGSGELRLRDVVRTLERQSGTRVLFHDRWVQPAQWQGRPAPIVITGGSGVGDHYELEGYVTLRVSRFLHVQMHLWLSEFTGSAPAVDVEIPFHLPELPPRHAGTPTVSTQSLLDGENDRGSAPAVADIGITGFNDQPITPAQVIALQQQRRVRFGELHYFDHPRFGALVQVTEFKPESTTAAVDDPAQSAAR